MEAPAIDPSAPRAIAQPVLALGVRPTVTSLKNVQSWARDDNPQPASIRRETARRVRRSHDGRPRAVCLLVMLHDVAHIAVGCAHEISTDAPRLHGQWMHDVVVA